MGLTPLLTVACAVAGLLLAEMASGAQSDSMATGDGLALRLSAAGRVQSVILSDRDIAAGNTGGFVITDVAAGGKSAPVTGSFSRTEGSWVFEGQAQDLGVKLTALYKFTPTFIRIHCTVNDLRGLDRGLVVSHALPVDATGWRWWRDIQNTQVIEPGRGYEDTAGARAFSGIAEYMNQPGLDVGQHSRLFCAAITPPAGAADGGLSYAVPLDELRLFRTGYNGVAKQFFIAYDLALCADTQPPSEATFTFLIQRVDARWGLRDALGRYYATYPRFFEKVIQKQGRREGTWMPFEDLENIDNANEFGFGVQESAPNPVYDNLLGVPDAPYFGGGSEVLWVPDYTPGQDPKPPYDRLVELFDASLKRRYGVSGAYEEACIQGVDGRCEMTDAAPYGHFGSQLDSNVAYAYGDAMLAVMLETIDAGGKEGGRLDGVFCDGFAAGLDYNREHFRQAGFPPIWDPFTNKPLLYNYFSSVEFARAAQEALHKSGRVTMMNGAMSSDMFGAPYLDYMLQETDLEIPREGLSFVRSICNRKTFMTLLKGDYTAYTREKIEAYMQRCVAYGVFPGFFDWYTSGLGPGSSYWVHPEYYNRDRELFRKYVPLCRMIATAGWEPVTLAECDNPRIAVERWGRAADDNLAFTLLNTSPDKEEAATLTVSRSEVPASVADPVAFDQVSGCRLPAETDGANVRISASLPPGGLALVQLGSRKGFAAGQARLVKDVVAAGLLQAQVDVARGRVDLPRFWCVTSGSRSFAGEAEAASPHSGALCIRCDNSVDATQRHSVHTWVNLHQKKPGPFTISAWSRAEGVSGQKDDGYSLRIALGHVTNYTEMRNQALQFEPGTHGWQQVSVTINSPDTIDAIQLEPAFEGHGGIAWFDDITLTTPDGKQWVVDPGFEHWDWRPVPGDPAAGKLDAVFKEITEAADAILAGAEPNGQFRTIIQAADSINPETTRPRWPFARQSRDLADCARLAEAALDRLRQ